MNNTSNNSGVNLLNQLSQGQGMTTAEKNARAKLVAQNQSTFTNFYTQRYSDPMNPYWGNRNVSAASQRQLAAYQGRRVQENVLLANGSATPQDIALWRQWDDDLYAQAISGNMGPNPEVLANMMSPEYTKAAMDKYIQQEEAYNKYVAIDTSIKTGDFSLDDENNLTIADSVYEDLKYADSDTLAGWYNSLDSQSKIMLDLDGIHTSGDFVNAFNQVKLQKDSLAAQGDTRGFVDQLKDFGMGATTSLLHGLWSLPKAILDLGAFTGGLGIGALTGNKDYAKESMVGMDQTMSWVDENIDKLNDLTNADMESIGGKIGSGIGGFGAFMLKGMAMPMMFGGTAVSNVASGAIIDATVEGAEEAVVERMIEPVVERNVERATEAVVERTAEAGTERVVETAVDRTAEKAVQATQDKALSIAEEKAAAGKAARESFNMQVNNKTIKANAGTIVNMGEERFVNMSVDKALTKAKAIEGKKAFSERQLRILEEDVTKEAKKVYGQAKLQTLGKGERKAAAKAMKSNMNGLEKFIPNTFKTAGVGRAAKSITRMIAVESAATTTLESAKRGDSNAEIISRGLLSYGGANWIWGKVNTGSSVLNKMIGHDANSQPIRTMTGTWLRTNAKHSAKMALEMKAAGTLDQVALEAWANTPVLDTEGNVAVDANGNPIYAREDLGDSLQRIFKEQFLTKEAWSEMGINFITGMAWGAGSKVISDFKNDNVVKHSSKFIDDEMTKNFGDTWQAMKDIAASENKDWKQLKKHEQIDRAVAYHLAASGGEFNRVLHETTIQAQMFANLMQSRRFTEGVKTDLQKDLEDASKLIIKYADNSVYEGLFGLRADDSRVLDYNKKLVSEVLSKGVPTNNPELFDKEGYVSVHKFLVDSMTENRFSEITDVMPDVEVQHLAKMSRTQVEKVLEHAKSRVSFEKDYKSKEEKKAELVKKNDRLQDQFNGNEKAIKELNSDLTMAMLESFRDKSRIEEIRNNISKLQEENKTLEKTITSNAKEINKIVKEKSPYDIEIAKNVSSILEVRTANKDNIISVMDSEGITIKDLNYWQQIGIEMSDSIKAYNDKMIETWEVLDEQRGTPLKKFMEDNLVTSKKLKEWLDAKKISNLVYKKCIDTLEGNKINDNKGRQVAAANKVLNDEKLHNVVEASSDYIKEIEGKEINKETIKTIKEYKKPLESAISELTKIAAEDNKMTLDAFAKEFEYQEPIKALREQIKILDSYTINETKTISEEEIAMSNWFAKNGSVEFVDEFGIKRTVDSYVKDDSTTPKLKAKLYDYLRNEAAMKRSFADFLLGKDSGIITMLTDAPSQTHAAVVDKALEERISKIEEALNKANVKPEVVVETKEEEKIAAVIEQVKPSVEKETKKKTKRERAVTDLKLAVEENKQEVIETIIASVSEAPEEKRKVDFNNQAERTFNIKAIARMIDKPNESLYVDINKMIDISDTIWKSRPEDSVATKEELAAWQKRFDESEENISKKLSKLNKNTLITIAYSNLSNKKFSHLIEIDPVTETIDFNKTYDELSKWTKEDIAKAITSDIQWKNKLVSFESKNAFEIKKAKMVSSIDDSVKMNMVLDSTAEVFKVGTNITKYMHSINNKEFIKMFNTPTDELNTKNQRDINERTLIESIISTEVNDKGTYIGMIPREIANRLGLDGTVISDRIKIDEELLEYTDVNNRIEDAMKKFKDAGIEFDNETNSLLTDLSLTYDLMIEEAKKIGNEKGINAEDVVLKSDIKRFKLPSEYLNDESIKRVAATLIGGDAIIEKTVRSVKVTNKGKKIDIFGGSQKSLEDISMSSTVATEVKMLSDERKVLVDAIDSLKEIDLSNLDEGSELVFRELYSQIIEREYNVKIKENSDKKKEYDAKVNLDPSLTSPQTRKAIAEEKSRINKEFNESIYKIDNIKLSKSSVSSLIDKATLALQYTDRLLEKVSGLNKDTFNEAKIIRNINKLQERKERVEHDLDDANEISINYLNDINSAEALLSNEDTSKIENVIKFSSKEKDFVRVNENKLSDLVVKLADVREPLWDKRWEDLTTGEKVDAEEFLKRYEKYTKDILDATQKTVITGDISEANQLVIDKGMWSLKNVLIKGTQLAKVIFEGGREIKSLGWNESTGRFSAKSIDRLIDEKNKFNDYISEINNIVSTPLSEIDKNDEIDFDSQAMDIIEMEHNKYDSEKSKDELEVLEQQQKMLEQEGNFSEAEEVQKLIDDMGAKEFTVSNQQDLESAHKEFDDLIKQIKKRKIVDSKGKDLSQYISNVIKMSKVMNEIVGTMKNIDKKVADIIELKKIAERDLANANNIMESIKDVDADVINSTRRVWSESYSKVNGIEKIVKDYLKSNEFKGKKYKNIADCLDDIASNIKSGTDLNIAFIPAKENFNSIRGKQLYEKAIMDGKEFVIQSNVEEVIKGYDSTGEELTAHLNLINIKNLKRAKGSDMWMSNDGTLIDLGEANEFKFISQHSIIKIDVDMARPNRTDEVQVVRIFPEGSYEGKLNYAKSEVTGLAGDKLDLKVWRDSLKDKYDSKNKEIESLKEKRDNIIKQLDSLLDEKQIDGQTTLQILKKNGLVEEEQDLELQVDEEKLGNNNSVLINKQMTSFLNTFLKTNNIKKTIKNLIKRNKINVVDGFRWQELGRNEIGFELTKSGINESVYVDVKYDQTNNSYKTNIEIGKIKSTKVFSSSDKDLTGFNAAKAAYTRARQEVEIKLNPDMKEYYSKAAIARQQRQELNIDAIVKSHGIKDISAASDVMNKITLDAMRNIGMDSTVERILKENPNLISKTLTDGLTKGEPLQQWLLSLNIVSMYATEGQGFEGKGALNRVDWLNQWNDVSLKPNDVNTIMRAMSYPRLETNGGQPSDKSWLSSEYAKYDDVINKAKSAIEKNQLDIDMFRQEKSLLDMDSPTFEKDSESLQKKINSLQRRNAELENKAYEAHKTKALKHNFGSKETMEWIKKELVRLSEDGIIRYMPDKTRTKFFETKSSDRVMILEEVFQLATEDVLKKGSDFKLFENYEVDPDITKYRIVKEEEQKSTAYDDAGNLVEIVKSDNYIEGKELNVENLDFDTLLKDNMDALGLIYEVLNKFRFYANHSESFFKDSFLGDEALDFEYNGGLPEQRVKSDTVRNNKIVYDIISIIKADQNGVASSIEQALKEIPKTEKELDKQEQDEMVLEFNDAEETIEDSTSEVKDGCR